MDFFTSIPVWAGVLLIFLLRVLEMSFDTVRVLMVVRNRKAYAWGIGFFQSILFVLAITTVLSNLGNPLNVLAYAAGFATGVVIGMMVEERMAIGFTHIRIVSPGLGAKIADRLRADGHALTEVPARGKDGAVTLINCSVLRKHVDPITRTVKQIDPNAFITAEDLRPVRRGFWRA
ncbi:MAG TPA: DUF5698 domain-containing protein [Anaerolineales bacterium]|nr:DUF5698 domain-containing protein [Anaerolineales bacterium]